MTDVNKPFILIDGSSYLYRAFHALPSLANTKGEPTGAIYGVISMIKKLLADYKPEYMAVVFDPKGKTQRDAIYSEYKAHRPAMPSELTFQIKYIYQIIEALGLPIVVYEGIEADDVIGTLALKAKDQGMTTLISTGDKDMTQLVCDSITLINTMTGYVYDREGVIKKFGIPPEQIIDYLALIGDKVDNIPGVPNVGPKTALKWLVDYGSVENIIQNAQDFKGKVGDNLRAAITSLELSKKLVTIYTDLELPDAISSLKVNEPNKTELIELFKHLEFKGWLSELLSEQISDQHEHYNTILNEVELDSWIERLKQCSCFAFDIETTHPDAMVAELVGIAFAIAPKQAIYVPLAHSYDAVPQQLETSRVLNKLRNIFSDPQKTLIAENVKYIMNVLLRYGTEIGNNVYDTMLESYLLNSATARHDRNTLSLKFLGRRAMSYEDIAGKGIKQLTCNSIDIEKVTQFAAESADIALQLHDAMGQKLADEPDLSHNLHRIEMPLTRVLARMEFTGVLIDERLLMAQSNELHDRLALLEKKAFEEAGCKFNLNSPKQLQTILYEKLQIPVMSKTPTGQPSTSETVLQELAIGYLLPRIILEHRSLNKIKSTYTDRLPLQINPSTGRVHTCYNQAVTSTGRLSSTDPNLQNIPIRTEEGRRIRRAFVAPPGYKIVSADYSQIELRIMAHLSKDPGLLKAFELKQDVHTATASEVFNVELTQVTDQQRRSAKAINFGLIYGMSPFGLSRQLGIDRNLAQEYINRYFIKYPNILAYMENTRQLAHQQGYVETLNKRKLFLPEINATNQQRQKAAERAAINAPLQGTAAEIIKLAMINIDRWLRESKLETKMIMQVHDELIFEVPEFEVSQVIENIKRHMAETVQLDVPLEVDIGVGDNWDEAH